MDVDEFAGRREALTRKIGELLGRRADEVCVVGCRPTGRPSQTHLPYIDVDDHNRARVAHALFRLVEARIAPAVISRVALSLNGSSLKEVILASEPDAVVLDVRWAAELERVLRADFAGPIYRTGQADRPAPADPKWWSLDRSSKVSIVLPTHNGSRYLRQSIESCLGQSYDNLELIVVDDGSAEDIRGLVGEFADPRLRFVRKETNHGLPAALNTGFELASGDYLTWTSDDNYYQPDAIERLLRFLQRHPAFGFVYSSIYIVDDRQPGLPTRVRRALPPADLKRQNCVGACFLYRRKVYESVGLYDSEAVLVEDYDYWVRVASRFRMQRLVAPLYYYRYHDKSLTSQYSPDEVARRFDVVRAQNGIT
jgi:GT2 family glycosyltransferase